jgi:hypothetical protein
VVSYSSISVWTEITVATLGCQQMFFMAVATALVSRSTCSVNRSWRCGWEWTHCTKVRMAPTIPSMAPYRRQVTQRVQSVSSSAPGRTVLRAVSPLLATKVNDHVMCASSAAIVTTASPSMPMVCAIHMGDSPGLRSPIAVQAWGRQELPKPKCHPRKCFNIRHLCDPHGFFAVRCNGWNSVPYRPLISIAPP